MIRIDVIKTRAISLSSNICVLIRCVFEQLFSLCVLMYHLSEAARVVLVRCCWLLLGPKVEIWNKFVYQGEQRPQCPDGL